jgi:hypothetical protein
MRLFQWRCGVVIERMGNQITQRIILIASVVIVVCAPPAVGSAQSGDYFIIGANTAQKVRWEVSSSHGPGHTGLMALDSDPESSWMSERSDSPQWLRVDFGTKRLLTKSWWFRGTETTPACSADVWCSSS